MNAPFVPDLLSSDLLPSTIDPVTPRLDWNSMTSAIDVWRGKCLQEFARIERAVSETLVYLSKDKVSGSVSLPLLIGCRLVELERVLAVSKASSTAKALCALQAFRAHDRLRVFLCHGQASVLKNRQGDWHVALQLLAFRNGVAASEDRLISQVEMEPAYETMRRDGQRLVSLLAVLRSA